MRALRYDVQPLSRTSIPVQKDRMTTVTTEVTATVERALGPFPQPLTVSRARTC